MIELQRLATLHTYHQRNFLFKQLINQSPAYARKIIAKDFARLLLSFPQSQLRVAILDFCFIRYDEVGRQSEISTEKMAELYTTFLLDLYNDACMVLYELSANGKQKRRISLLAKLKLLLHIGEKKRLLKKYGLHHHIWDTLIPFEFVDQVSRAEIGLRFGPPGMSVQEREAWGGLEGKDFILSSNALKSFKDKLRALRKPIISVEAI